MAFNGLCRGSLQQEQLPVHNEQIAQGFFLPRRGLDLSQLNSLYIPRLEKVKLETALTKSNSQQNIYNTLNPAQQHQEKTKEQSHFLRSSMPSLIPSNLPTLLSEKQRRKSIRKNDKQPQTQGDRMKTEGSASQEDLIQFSPSKQGILKGSFTQRTFSKVQFASLATTIQPDGQTVTERTLKKGVLKELTRVKNPYLNY